MNGVAQYDRGNEVLRLTGQAIVGISSSGTRVFRWGADEFAVLLPTAAIGEAVHLGERICAAVASIAIPDSTEPVPGPSRLTCSIGVAFYPGDGQTVTGLLAAADQWEFFAKHMGGGRVALADTASMPRLVDPSDGVANRP